MNKTLGQLVYEAFFGSMALELGQDIEIGGWEKLSQPTRDAWETAGRAALRATIPVIPVDLAVDVLVNACHSAADKAGWWVDPKSGVDVRDNPLCFSNKMALIHSEVSEALEGDRKNKMDDHLAHLPSRDVEMADALIRIADTSGGFKLQLARAVVEKLAYNAQRADHKLANRQAEGGKAY